MSITLLLISYTLSIIDGSTPLDSSSSINIISRNCENDISCGVSFNDITGELQNNINFEAEYILEGAGFDGSVWVDDCSYPNNGYLLFVLLGPDNESGLYKMIQNDDEINIELVTLSPSTADVAWSSATPNKAYLTSLVGQQIIVVDLDTCEITNTYGWFEGKQFAGPDGIYADENGNIYFTDTDYNVNDDANPSTTHTGGNLFRIDVLNDKVFLEATVEYGFNGITLNNIYGEGTKLVASNTVDLPDDIYDIMDNTQMNADKIYIAEFRKNNDGSLTDNGILYSICDDASRFPLKTFLDGMTFDTNNNLYVSVIVNQTISKLVVLNENGEIIGEIIFQNGFAVNAITLAGDGYFYASLVNFPQFSIGEFVRFKAKNVPDLNVCDSNSGDSSDSSGSSEVSIVSDESNDNAEAMEKEGLYGDKLQLGQNDSVNAFEIICISVVGLVCLLIILCLIFGLRYVWIKYKCGGFAHKHIEINVVHEDEIENIQIHEDNKEMSAMITT